MFGLLVRMRRGLSSLRLREGEGVRFLALGRGVEDAPMPWRARKTKRAILFLTKPQMRPIIPTFAKPATKTDSGESVRTR